MVRHGEAGWGRVRQGGTGWDRVSQGDTGWGRVRQGETGWGRVRQGEAGWGRVRQDEIGWDTESYQIYLFSKSNVKSNISYERNACMCYVFSSKIISGDHTIMNNVYI